MKKGLLLVISGPSGAGKGTICKRLLETDANIKVSISTTTRLPRIGEVEGENYFFIDKNKFADMKDNNEFLEYAKVYDNYYGTPIQFVMDNINRGDNVLLEIDIDGALQIKDKFEEAVFVFILPPSLKELKNRIVSRGTESKHDIDKRFSLAQGEIRQVIKYDYAVLNDDLVKAIDDIKAIIAAEKCKVMRVYEDIKKMIWWGEDNMLRPSVQDMKTLISSRYSVVIAVSKRAREIVEGDEVRIETDSIKPVSIATQEIFTGKVICEEDNELVNLKIEQ